MTITKTAAGVTLTLTLTRVGEDWNAVLSGGQAPHIGSVAVALPRQSLTGSGERSCTSSVYNLTGHKDEALCRRCAESICIAAGRTCVCSGGVHIDHITPEGIRGVTALAEELLAEACRRLKHEAPSPS